MKRKIVFFAFILIGFILTFPHPVFAGPYKIESQESEIIHGCQSKDDCSWEGTVLFKNKLDQSLYETTLWSHTLKFIGFNGQLTDRSSTERVIAPGQTIGPIRVKATYPDGPYFNDYYPASLYIDGKTCKDTNPPDCYFYGGTEFNVKLDIVEPTSTPVPTNTPTPFPTVTPIPTATTQPSPTLTDSSDGQTNNQQPTYIPTPTATPFDQDPSSTPMKNDKQKETENNQIKNKDLETETNSVEDAIDQEIISTPTPEKKQSLLTMFKRKKHNEDEKLTAKPTIETQEDKNEISRKTNISLKGNLLNKILAFFANILKFRK